MARSGQVSFIEMPSSLGVFKLPESVTKALKTVRLRPLQVDVEELGGHGNVVV